MLYLATVIMKGDKYGKTNCRGPIKIWVPKKKLFVADFLSNRVKTPVMVLGQWLLMAHDGRKAYVPKPNTKAGRHSGSWRKSEGRIIDSGAIGNSYFLSIHNVWLVDGLKHNLLSISQLRDGGYVVVYNKTVCKVINQTDGSIFLSGKRKNNAYKINFFDLAEQKVKSPLSMNDKK